MSPSTRRAREEDREAVLALLEAEGLDAIFASGEVWVTEEGGRVLATARIQPLPDGSHELASVAVDPAHHGRGIGTQLVERALADIETDVHALGLAPAFLEQLGFEPSEEVPEPLEQKATSVCQGTGFVPMTRTTGDDPLASVRTRYGAVAQAAEQDLGGSGTVCCTPQAPARARAESEDLPPAADLGLGTGDVIDAADLQEGEAVLDLGSGPGGDAIRAGRLVGPEGHVWGVDATPEMVELARRNAAEAGVGNVTFLSGTLERLPLPDEHVDVAVSNCVINLVEEKARAIEEAFRVLEPGGRLAVSDTVAIDPAASDSEDAAVGCTPCTEGAWTASRWREALREVGFVDVTLEVDPPTGRFGDAVGTVMVRARRPG